MTSSAHEPAELRSPNGAEPPVPAAEVDVVRLERAAVQRFRAGQATFERSSVGIATFDRGTIRQSAAGVVVARSLAADQARVGILVSPIVRGEVHTLVDMRSAVALGFGMALGTVVLSTLRAGLRRLR